MVHNDLFETDRLSFGDEWHGKSGKVVEDFISRELLKGIKSMDYRDSNLYLERYNGEILQKEITMVPPNYVTEIKVQELIINGVPYTNSAEVNYTESSIFRVGFNLKTYYETLGNFYNLLNKVDITFSIVGTTDFLIVKNIDPNKFDDDSLQYVDITPIFQKNMSGATLRATVTVNNITSESDFQGITIHKIELNTDSTTVDNKTVVFNISGLKSTSNMLLEYFDVPFGTQDISKISKQTASLTGISSTELVLDSVGAHQIVARISNPEGTFYSNWVQANVVSYDSTNPVQMMGIIGGIPDKITNCENANLYKVMYVPGLGGDIEITSYLTDEAGKFEDEDWTPYIFNSTSISTTSNDVPATTNYFSYVELTSVGNQSKVIAFRMTINGESYPIYKLSVNNLGNLRSDEFFTINIVENPYNINNCFNYVEGAREDFSQITGQATTLFKNINPEIEASDGWTTDDNMIAYKISGQSKNLFSTPKDYLTLLNSGKGFTIEIMLKNYNINGEDPVISIGNLLLGPGFARIYNSDSNDESGIFVNSRADFEKEVVTHLMFVYDPAYKPKTYNNIYDQLFNEDGQTYSGLQHTYPIMKIYVNGTINREIQIDPDLLKDENGFKLQICPISSDLNLYIFRTYSWAFSYNEIQKNYISSRSTSLEKKAIYDRNDILAEDGRISFYKTMQNHNVIVFVIPKDDKPLYFGNRKTNGDGVDPQDANAKSKATILIHYANPAYAKYCGRFTEGKYKAQGSSAKKYMIHNTQYSGGTFISEEDIKAGITTGSTKYAIPTDSEQLMAKKMVGKVNYASSMQSHKMGAIKLYDKAYKEIFGSNSLYNGGKKACIEDAFVYFYYNLDDNSKLNSITIDDLYTTSVVNNVIVANDSDVKFLGFQTWGSAKADDPTYGYGDNTPEYVLFEGADNASPGANFKQPWAAFQTWTSDKTMDEHTPESGYIIQQTEDVTKSDYTTGLLIEGETIKFESGTDPLDVDYGIELIILDGEDEEVAEKRDVWKFTDEVKNNSLKYFVEFYNNCYQYDFTALIPNPESSKFDLTNDYGLTNRRIYMTRSTTLYKGNTNTGDTASSLDVYRWDIIKRQWVPAGLHYKGSNWNRFNLAEVYRGLTNTDLFKKYQNNSSIIDISFFGNTVSNSKDVDEYVIPAFRDMYKATVEEYCDKNDIAYHQAFIRLVSGTDNRAKNTYFQIVGKLYTDKAIVNDVEVSLVKVEIKGETKKRKGYIDSNIFKEVSISNGVVTPTGFEISAEGLKSSKYCWKQTEVGDYKIRLMQDDLDTIFATDNNGQQVKPYYLLEPAFNLETAEHWGDERSSFFYPFDVCYYELINTYLNSLISHLFGTSTSIKSTDSNLYKYFFKVQNDFPEIAYNHHAEIYYEVPQLIFSNMAFLQVNGSNVFPNTLSGYLNNNVKNPLSLSHGRCLESEYQFMKDRLLLLGTQSNQAHGLYKNNEITLSTEPTGGDNNTATFEANVTFTDYFYPVSTVKGSANDTYTKIININSLDETTIKPDEVFSKILETPGIPSVVRQLVTPDLEFHISCPIGTTLGAQLGAGNKYKTVKVIRGLDFQHQLLRLTNAKSLIVDGITANYSISDQKIKVKDFLPIVEHLELTNVHFNNTTLDFRGCNRLTVINLSGCTGVADIIFPETNKLSEVYLPNDLKKLTLGRNPNLSVFSIPESIKLTELSLNCSEFNSNFDYLSLLVQNIDYANLKQFIITNTPEKGLNITNDIATIFANVKLNPSANSLIRGTFNIKVYKENIDDLGNTQYTWEDFVDISYNDKKYLTRAFGNIDSDKNTVRFKYQESVLIASSAVLPQQIVVDIPENGIVIEPFDSLYFTAGNSVAINDLGKLKITYNIVGLPSDIVFDQDSGILTASANTNKSYSCVITVWYKNNNREESFTLKTSLYLGYIEPAIGDYAYSDGTFSAIYQSNKTLVGLVYQKQVIQPGLEWNLGILSKEAVTDFAGADYYALKLNNATTEHHNIIKNFLTNSEGLGCSSSDLYNYLGVDSEYFEDYIYGDTIDTSSINRITYSVPSTIQKTGKTSTQLLCDSGLNRIKYIADKFGQFRKFLEDNNYLDSQQNLIIDNINISNLETIFNNFNEVVKTKFDSDKAIDVKYHTTLNPLFIKASLYEPQNLSNEGVDYYSRGNWYIPSKEELSLLIWYRVLSTTSTTTTEPESYWNSTNYKNGNSIFTTTYPYFTAFLNNSTMLCSSISNDLKNVIYNTIEYYDYNKPPTYKDIRYGWAHLYVLKGSNEYYNNSYAQYANDACRRDFQYTVTPCCVINVKKKTNY